MKIHLTNLTTLIKLIFILTIIKMIIYKMRIGNLLEAFFRSGFPNISKITERAAYAID